MLSRSKLSKIRENNQIFNDDMKKAKKSSRFERIAYAIFAAPVRFFARIRVTGKENIPAEGGCVVCVNHIAFWDPIVLSAAFPVARMPRYLAKAELFRIPILRGLLRAFGATPLDRGGSDVGAIRRAITIAEGGELLTLFPQGTRQKGKNPADTPIKSGAAMIAAHAKVGILPVCIKMKRQRYALFRRIHILIGEVMSAEELGLLSEEPNYREATGRAFSATCALGGYYPSAIGEGEAH